MMSPHHGVPVAQVTMILNGQRGVSADTALRLVRYFGTTRQLWLTLQETWSRHAEVFVPHALPPRSARSEGDRRPFRATPRLSFPCSRGPGEPC